MSGSTRASTILILIATERVSGPLKGVFQFWRHMDTDRYRPLLGLVRSRRAEPSDAELEAQGRGIPYVVLEQSGSFDWRLFGQARRLAVEHSAALVQTHGYKTHLLGLFLKRALDLPWVGFEHGWTAESWRIKLYHRLDWLLRYADRVVAVSDYQCTQLLEMGVSESRLLRVHNAVEYDEGWGSSPPGVFRQAQRIPVDAPLISVIGRVSREKGQRHFVDAFRSLNATFPTAHAAIVGEGIDTDAVRDHARNSGLWDTIRFVEWQRPAIQVYVDSDVIAIPSLSEGVSNVLLEAMAAGCPVVATGVGGTMEVVTHERHALLVPPANPGAMADAITRLLQDKPLRDRLVEQARRLMEADYSPTQRSASIAGTYAYLLGR